MKRAIISIFILVYFTVSTGFTVNLHYCMDDFQSWEFGASDEESCGKCGMPVSDGGSCCRDEVKVVKLQLEPLQSTTISLPPLFEYFAQGGDFPYSLIPLHHFTIKGQHYAHSPPLLSKQDTYLQIRVFRI